MIIILGFDALEYDRACEMPELQLQSFGKMNNDVGYSIEITPVLWSTIITGQMPEVHGVTWHGGEDLNAGLKKKILCPTLFDEIPGSIPINVPNVTLKYYEVDRLKEIWKIHNRALFLEYANDRYNDMRKRTTSLKSHIVHRTTPLVMAYYAAPDTIQHLFPNDEDADQIDELYRFLAATVTDVQTVLKPEDILIIISDHGQKKGVHTPYAWFSINRPNITAPKHILDFKSFVMGLNKNEAGQTIH